MRTVRVVAGEGDGGGDGDGTGSADGGSPAGAGGPAGTERSTDVDAHSDADDIETGEHYVLLKASGDAWLVRDPATGERRYLPADRLEPVDESPLAAAARGVPAPVRRLVTAVHDERALGLLVELVDRGRADADDAGGPESAANTGPGPGTDPEPGPTSVRVLLDATALCESDLHGALAELAVAGLVERVESEHGGRAYRPTDRAVAAVARLRGVRETESSPESETETESSREPETETESSRESETGS